MLIWQVLSFLLSTWVLFDHSRAWAEPRAASENKVSLLKFPKTSVGTVFEYSPTFDFCSGGYRGRPLGPAQGDVRYLTENPTGLVLNYAGAQDLSFFENESLSALRLVHTNQLAINMKSVVYLSHLTHLSYLNMEGADVRDSDLKNIQP